MASVTVSASITIQAPAEAVFAVLTDPAKHAAIDGTGWVGDPLDRQILMASEQIFRMASVLSAAQNIGHRRNNMRADYALLYNQSWLAARPRYPSIGWAGNPSPAVFCVGVRE